MGISMGKLWVVFRHKGKELLRYTVKGMSVGEAEETIKLLAYEKSIPAEEIEVVFGVED